MSWLLTPQPSGMDDLQLGVHSNLRSSQHRHDARTNHQERGGQNRVKKRDRKPVGRMHALTLEGGLATSPRR